MAGVIDASKMPGPLEAKWAVTAAPAEHRRQAFAAGFTLNTSLAHQMLQAKAQGLLAHQAPHNGNNCVTGWQFTGPFDSTNAAC